MWMKKLNNMKNIFNYTYYRITKFYYKKDGSDATTALLTITLILSLFLISIEFIISGYFGLDRKISTLEIILILIVMFVFYLILRKRYENKYSSFREKWIKETNNKKRLNGFLVILFILSPLILIVIVASFFGKLNL